MWLFIYNIYNTWTKFKKELTHCVALHKRFLPLYNTWPAIISHSDMRTSHVAAVHACMYMYALYIYIICHYFIILVGDIILLSQGWQTKLWWHTLSIKSACSWDNLTRGMHRNLYLLWNNYFCSQSLNFLHIYINTQWHGIIISQIRDT